MTQAAGKITFEEYLNLDTRDWVRLGLPEGRCEYVDGELFELSPSRLNLRIANYLLSLLVQAGIPFYLIYNHAFEIEVLGKPRTRYPDLVILREEHLAPTKRRATITLDMPPPQLVAEVVSPGDDNEERDYTDKREQYQKRGIPEYWLINPEYQALTVLELKAGMYVKVDTFSGNQKISSPTYKTLELTAEQLFVAGR